MPSYAFDKFSNAVRGLRSRNDAALVEVQAIPGALDQFNRLAAGAVVQGLAANQSATGAAVPAPCLLYAIRCLASSAGIVTIYDNASTNSGKQIATSLALTTGQIYLLAGGAMESMSNGVYVTLVSGTATFDILHAPSV